MAPHLVTHVQFTDEFGYGRLSDIYQIIVGHQVDEAALQVDWFQHMADSLIRRSLVLIRRSAAIPLADFLRCRFLAVT